MTLAQETPILLLDEPTTFLDLAHQIEMMAASQQYGCGSVRIVD